MERCAQVINKTLHALFAENESVYLIGEDLLDPYGGAFKISAGLSTKFPARVLTTPISEAAITGVATGMALRGMRPIVEIMFGDFMSLAFDQILNHAAKFRQMYGTQVSCPLVIRTPMGGRRGYGATHSQSLEKYLYGIPGINVIALSAFHPLPEMLRAAVLESHEPTIIIENKLMYGQNFTPPQNGKINEYEVQSGSGPYPTLRFSLNGFRGSAVTVVTYGGMLPLVLEAALKVAIEDEVFVEVFAPARLNRLDLSEPREALAQSRKLLVCEEGTKTGGWGAEIVAALSENAAREFKSRRVAAKDSIIPTAKALEDQVLPQVADVAAALRTLAGS